MGDFRRMLAIFLLILTLCGCAKEEPEETVPIRNNRPQQTETLPDDSAGETLSVEIPEAPVSVSVPDWEGLVPVLGESWTVEQPEDVVFLRDLPARRWAEGEQDGYILLSFDLSDLLEGRIWQDYKRLSGSLVAAYEYSAELPRCSLVNVDTGEILLADGACEIERITDRFFLVRYADGVTHDPAEGVIRFSGSQFRPEREEDVLCRGYGRIFDLEAGAFVPGLTLDGADRVSVCGGRTICVETGWDSVALYTPEGTCLGENLPVTVCGDKLVQSAEGGLAVYDADYRYLRTIAGADILSASGAGMSVYSEKYLKYRAEDSGLLGVVDLGGHEMLSAAFDTISGAAGDYLIVGMEQDDDWRYGLYLADGTRVLSCEYEGIYGDSALPVIHYYDVSDHDYLYIPEVGSVDAEGLSRAGQVYYRCPNGAADSLRSYLIYRTGRYLTCSQGRVLGETLIYSPEMGLLEAIGGTTLLRPEEAAFDRLETAGAYLYCFDNEAGIVTVYHVN